MKRYALVACIALVLACVGCGTVGVITHEILPSDAIYGIVSLRDLPVGHVIKESDVMSTMVGTSYRELLHPFRPRPNSSDFTTDSSRIVGHTVKSFSRRAGSSARTTTLTRLSSLRRFLPWTKKKPRDTVGARRGLVRLGEGEITSREVCRD